MSFANFLDYHHFPVYSIMVLFLGAFLIVLTGKSKFLRNLIFRKYFINHLMLLIWL